MKQDKKKSSTYEMIYPVILLTVICLVASVLLGLTNSVTKPIIDEAEAQAAEATRKQLLPDAAGFAEVECDIDGVTSIFKDEGGSGYIIIVKGKGYKGALPVTVGISADGEVLGISVDASGETAGVGSKTSLPEFTGRFAGLTGSADGVDVITGASVSSRGVKAAVNQAFAAYEAVKEA